MLFRNPYRFGKRPPWRPLGSSKPIYNIDAPNNALSLAGYVFGAVEHAMPYKESIFRHEQQLNDRSRTLDVAAHSLWQQVLETVASHDENLPISQERITEIACSFSFGLDKAAEVADERLLLHNFIAYLKTVLSPTEIKDYIPADLLETFGGGLAKDFGQPVWEFEYPESALFITGSGMVGCCTAETRAGDFVFIPSGGTFPLLIRPMENAQLTIQGYGYVHRLTGMSGEITLPKLRTLKFS